MKFTVERNWIDVFGIIWLPPITAATRYNLDSYKMNNIGEPTRENVGKWLDTNAGDFQKIIDFRAIVGETEIPWDSEENEMAFNDCMYGGEE